MTRERLVWLLALVGLALGAWWLSVNTEWADDERPRPAQGAARDNPLYATEQLWRRLGLQVEHHEALTGLPPATARLVLLSSDWQLLPGRAEQLHQWVLQGGHLVLVGGTDWEDTALARWVPVEVRKPEGDVPGRPNRFGTSRAVAVQPTVTLASAPPLWGTTEALDACELGFVALPGLKPRAGLAPTWTLTQVVGSAATQAVVARQDEALRALRGEPPPPGGMLKPTGPVHGLRLPVGQGSVTVLNAMPALLHNGPALRCDNPLLLAAAVQAEPGATVWVYLNERRDSLLPWLWQQGWIAVATALLALAAGLWRAAVRFGPRLAPAPRLRRSIAEQVRGLGAYLQRGGREALLVAQQRALGEAAARVLPGFARLAAAARAPAIARATGLPADALATALAARACTRAELPQHLQLLETARRRLAKKTPEERHPPS